jgi:hypothetical protein
MRNADTPVQSLPLPLRVRNAIERHGIKTYAELVEAVAADKLNNVSGIGAIGLGLVRNIAADGIERANGASKPLRRTVREEVDLMLEAGHPAPLATPSDTAARAAITRAIAPVADHGIVATVPSIKTWTKPSPAKGVDGTQGRNAVPSSQENRMNEDALALTLENDILKRLDDLVPVIGGLPQVREFGVKVERKVVARMALLRGLDQLERAHAKSSAKTAEDAPKSDEDAPIEAPAADTTVHGIPEGWNKVSASERVPENHAALHDYYTARGWSRFWGKVDDTVFYFYWCETVANQALKPFNIGEKGRAVHVQDTPWGPGHILPAGW